MAQNLQDNDIVNTLRRQRVSREFNLRPTRERSSRLAPIQRSRSLSPPTQESDIASTPSFVPLSVPSSFSLTTPTQTHTQTTTQPTMASVIKIETKFTGYVPNTKENHRYTTYTVHRWLTDTENRIASKGITNDLDKIREARLAVHPDIGDAAAVVNSVEMLAVRSWDEFKRKCLLLWRSQSEQDSLLALSDLLNVPYYERQGDTISHLSKACDNVKQDIISKKKLRVAKANEWTDRPNEDLVSLREVFLHLSVGVIFNTLPPELKHTFRKVKFDTTDGLVEIMSKFSEEKAKTSNKASNNTQLACVTQTTKQNTTVHTNTHTHTKKFNNEQQPAQKHANVVCYKCRQLGHIAKECKAKQSALICTFCYRPGHLEKDCHMKAQVMLRKKKMSNKSCNVVDNLEENQPDSA